ncbi:hypothetical protein BJX96DRAFT_173753 [Aspergillus floccosus]
MQLAALIMGKSSIPPAFTTAGIYGVLSLMIPIIGQDKSPLRPNLYLIIFIAVDFFSLLLQAVGGGLVGAASGQNTSPWPGTYTMYVIYRGLGPIVRNQALQRISPSLMIAVTCMVARGVYRSMELMNGWRGYLFTHEVYTIILDAALMFIASLVLCVWNPASLILNARENARRMQAGVGLRREQGAKK